jgi:hypothetical protein
MRSGGDLALGALMRLMGVRLVSDLYERAADLGLRPPLDVKRRAWLSLIGKSDLLFIHVPKTAGMSISRALYGQHVTHCTIRYYRRFAPRIVMQKPSFAIVRDPVDRFLSAYAYARAGGSGDNRVSAAFRARYAGFRSLDDALDHVEAARSPYRMDHIFRPQAWFLTDGSGRLAVDTLIPFESLDHIDTFVAGFPRAALPHVNRCERVPVMPTLRQLERVRLFYASDFALYDVATERVGRR